MISSKAAAKLRANQASNIPPSLLKPGQRKDDADGRLSSEQAAAVLNISSSYLLKLVRQGVLPSTRAKGRHRFDREDLDRYLTARDALIPKGGFVRQADATRMLGFSSDVSIFRMARSGALTVFQNEKGQKRFRRADVEALIQAKAARKPKATTLFTFDGAATKTRDALVTVTEAGRMLGYKSPVSSAKRLSQNNTLTVVFNKKGQKRFNRADVEALVKARARKAGAATAKGLLKSGATA